MIRKAKKNVSKTFKRVKTVFKKESPYKYLENRYKDKVKLIFYLKNNPLEIKRLLDNNNIVVYKEGKEIFGISKYCKFHATTLSNMIYFGKAENISTTNNSLRNLYEIKRFNDFLINYARKDGFKEITIDTWLFEQFPEFSKYLGGYKAENVNELKLYRYILKKSNVRKIVSYDFNLNRLKCLTNNGSIVFLETFLPGYILKL